MKFIANRSELLPIAKRCCLVIGRQFTTKETVCVLMEADEKQNLVQFTARGNECVLQARLHCRVEQDGKALLIGSVFQSMLELFGDEATTVETDKSTIFVRNAKAGYRFTLMDTAKYPVPEPCTPDLLTEAGNFCEIGAKALFSAAKSNGFNSRALNCVHVMVHDGRWSATSCDGYRLTVVSEDTSRTEPLDLLLSVEAMKIVLNVFHGVKHCKIGVFKSYAVFCGPQIVLYAKLNEQKFTNVQPILDGYCMMHEIEVSGDTLLDSLKRVSAGSTNNAKLLLNQVDKHTLRLQFLSGMDSTITGQTELDCAVRTPLPQEGFCYNYTYLREAAVLMEGKNIEMQFDKGGALMLRADNELHLLLPLRLPKTEAKPKTGRTRKAA